MRAHLCSLLPACFALVTSVRAGTLTVGPGPGFDYATIQAAIDAAAAGDVITVADGVYSGAGNREIDLRGKAITLRSVNGAAVTIIDCQQSGRAFNVQANEGRDTVIEGFTLQGGNASPGSAMYLAGSVTVRSCVVKGNSGGTTVHINDSEPAIEDCVIRANQGSGIWAGDGCLIRSCTIENNKGRGIEHAAGLIVGCTIRNNDAGLQSSGGGLQAVDSRELIVAGTTFQGNRAGFVGGGASVGRVNRVLFTHCKFAGNNSASGAGLACVDGTVGVRYCEFVGNIANSGAAIQNSGIADIEKCHIVDNKATGQAGGITGRGYSTVRDTLFRGNQALEGGVCALDYYAPGNVILVNCTMVGNRAGRQGGLLSVLSGNATLHGCISWNNTAPSAQEIYVAGGTVNVYDSDIQYGRAGVGNQYGTVNWGAGNISEDPLFVAPADFQLSAGSPCIDRASDAVPGGLSRLDLQRKPRSMDGDGDGSSRPDMGAYESGDAEPLAEPVALAIFGPRSVPEGRSVQFTATGIYGDGTVRDVTSVVQWFVPVAPEADITASGLLHAKLVDGSRRTEVKAELAAPGGSLTSNRFIQISDSGRLEVVGSSFVGEGARVAFKAEFVPVGGAPVDVTPQTAWSISPGQWARIDAEGVVSGDTVTADAVETITATSQVNGVAQVSTKQITILENSYDSLGTGVLIERTERGVSKTPALAIGPDDQPAYVSVFEDSTSTRISLVARSPNGVWTTRLADEFNITLATGSANVAGPVLDRGQWAFAVAKDWRTSSGNYQHEVYYYRFNGNGWDKELVTTELAGVKEVVIDREGRPTIASYSGQGSSDGFFWRIFRLRREAAGWTVESFDRQHPSDTSYTFGLDHQGEIWYMRVENVYTSRVSYSGCITNPLIPESRCLDTQGRAAGPVRLFFDGQDRFWQIAAGPGVPVTVWRPTASGYQRDEVDDFGWAGSGCERIVFDAQNRPAAPYVMSAVASCGPGCGVALWDEVRVAVLVGDRWVVRRLAASPPESGVSVGPVGSAFDSTGRLHVLYQARRPDGGGFYHVMLQPGEELLAGGEFNDPTTFTLHFDRRYQGPDNDVSVVTDPDGRSYLQLYSGTGAPFGIAQETQVSTVLSVRFRYRFDTPGKLILRLGGVTLANIPAPSEGPGSRGSREWARYSRTFDFEKMGVNPAPPYLFELLLANAGDPLLMVDDLKLTTTPLGAPADFDGNGHVDTDDLKHFAECFTGPRILQNAPHCSDALLDGDNDVDQEDFGVFQHCYTGKNLPGDPNCGG